MLSGSRWLLACGKARKAERLLKAACDDVQDVVVCLRSRAQMAAAVDDAKVLMAAGKALASVACIEQEKCAAVHTWLGDLHAQRGELGTAVAMFRRAARDGENVARLVRLANVASRAGLHAQALAALERALRLRGGADAKLKARIKVERQKMLDTMLRH